jgi:hypothetical protein
VKYFGLRNDSQESNEMLLRFASFSSGRKGNCVHERTRRSEARALLPSKSRSDFKGEALGQL